MTFLKGAKKRDMLRLTLTSMNSAGGKAGTAFVVRDLPEYEILEIRTGQSLAGSKPLWEGRFTFGD